MYTIKNDNNTNIVRGTMGEVDIRMIIMVINANRTLKYWFTFLSPFECAYESRVSSNIKSPVILNFNSLPVQIQFI